ncbi:MAG: 23S rRNA (adenine(2503)-C(2))-methyltransferase RlmN [Chloroflexi bacterium]|nr:MAG: 23S rRNA (adenine(2503)-C(2))-methyltransferase RlmN [Chloroflexota bacterium]
MPQPIFELSLDQLRQQLAAWQQPAYRAAQLWSGLYSDLRTNFEEFSVLPRGLRAQLAATYDIECLQMQVERESKDGHTRKWLFGLAGGGEVETVLMAYDERMTVCISTQAGRAGGGGFWATRPMGGLRHPAAGEIVAQVLWAARSLKAVGGRLTNVVVMGMGEPFHNYEATMAALDRLQDPAGLGIGVRRITVSTVGLPHMIRRFAQEGRHEKLAVSLHAATDELRNRLVPINKRYPLAELIDACREYVRGGNRRLSMEWALIDGQNDSAEQAQLLVELVQGLGCHVNLIPLNPTGGYAGLRTGREAADRFKSVLDAGGVACTIRVRRGIDIGAGCGQLRTKAAGGKARSALLSI